MTRFQTAAALTVVTTLVLITIGVIVRATDSGLACPTWPGCFDGRFLPALSDGYQVWLEWIHRTVAVVVGIEVLVLGAVALRDHRDRPSLLWPSLAAVALVGFQAWLGRETVRLGNSGESVTAHLAAAMALVGLLVYLVVRAGYPARIAGRGGSQRFALLAAFGAATTFALLLFGSNVTAMSAALVFPDWPLMNGTLLPVGPGTDPGVVPLYEAHAYHRYVAVVVGVVLAIVAIAAARTGQRRGVVWTAVAAALLYPLQAVVGGLQVITRLEEWTQTAHLALGAVIWGLTAATAVAAHYDARRRVPVGHPDPGEAPARGGPADEGRASRRATGDTIRAYVGLTKPRIIELLLITTIPAMVLATRETPMDPGSWLWLATWTIVAGSLAAGSANAINQYLERDIDELMARTRRRQLPSNEVEPERAVAFGIGLGIASLALMAYFVNLVAAFLTLLAIGFYVVVYTLMLKRTTPQNIVIGGAAGALPPVIGWAAVTGRVEVPALLLFALVFYWTPPHFWALSLRIRKDYAAANVPMLPVVRGVPETARQIALYTILMVAVSLVFFAVARMGLLYLAAALILGALFLWRAFVLWRQAASPEGSLAQAIRLYRYSITYLTLLFLAVALDGLLAGPLT